MTTATLPTPPSGLALDAPSLVPAPVTDGPVFTGHVGAVNGGWRFEVFDRIARVGPEVWRECFPSHWKQYLYYQTLEETFADEFPQRYLVLRPPSAAGAICAIQPLFFVEQDLTAGLGARARAALAPVRRWLRMRLMMVGCVVGEGQIGVRPPMKVREVCGALDDALTQYAAHERVSIVLLKDFPVGYRSSLDQLVRTGRYTRLPSLPAVGLELEFASFEEYLQTRLGKSTRKSLRRKFKDVERLTAGAPITLQVKDTITPDEATVLHALYERVARRGDVHFEVFSREYFLRLGERLPGHTRFFVWSQSDRVVAFSFCMVDGDTIYDNDLGVDEAAGSTLHLYHYTFRDIISWAIDHGLKHYYSSPFNYDPKLHLRMHLEPLDLYARHASPLVNFFLRRIAPALAPTRQEPLLARFPNAAEITARPIP